MNNIKIAKDCTNGAVNTERYAREMLLRDYYVCWPGCTLKEWVDALQALKEKNEL